MKLRHEQELNSCGGCLQVEFNKAALSLSDALPGDKKQAMNRLLKVRPSVHMHSPAHAETVSAKGMDLITLSTLHLTRRAIVMADRQQTGDGAGTCQRMDLPLLCCEPAARNAYQ